MSKIHTRRAIRAEGNYRADLLFLVCIFVIACNYVSENAKLWGCDNSARQIWDWGNTWRKTTCYWALNGRCFLGTQDVQFFDLPQQHPERILYWVQCVLQFNTFRALNIVLEKLPNLFEKGEGEPSTLHSNATAGIDTNPNMPHIKRRGTDGNPQIMNILGEEFLLEDTLFKPISLLLDS